MSAESNSIASCVHVARVTIELVTPLSIATGSPDGEYDTALVRDANGLPAIPGTSLAGVLRHLYQSRHGEQATNMLFGYQNGDQGERSRFEISWGCIHDSHNQAVDHLLLGEKDEKRLKDDPLLSFAAKTKERPALRDRVRLNQRGTAEDGGKFDRSVVPAGYRFSFELTLWSHVKDDPQWSQLLSLLTAREFRLGGETRGGLGAIFAKAISQRSFDLRQSADLTRYSQLSPFLSQREGLTVYTPVTDVEAESVTVKLELTPVDFWRVGQGDQDLRAKPEKPANLLPKVERVVTWSGDQGRFGERQLVVPASGIKGAVGHRLAFHFNRLTGTFVEDFDPTQLPNHTDNEGVRAFFGHAHARSDEETDTSGKAGSVIIDDIFLTFSETDVHTLTHNSIDRFTGGVRNGMLFTEQLIRGKSFEFALTVVDKNASRRPEARAAFAAALEDLIHGRLALGAGASRGHGYFNGSATWSDGGQWIKESNQ